MKKQLGVGRARALRGWLREQWSTNLRIPAYAVLFGLLVGGLFTLAIGQNPLMVYWAILYAFFSGFLEVVGQATPLICTGLAVALAFRCGLFNIGVEGQITIAMLASGVVGVKLGFLPGIILLPLCILSGILAGALWAGIPGWLKAKRGIHEVINSIMMNYIALYLVNTLVLSKWLKAPNYGATYPVPTSAWLPRLAGTQVSANMGLFLALGAVFLVYWILWHSTLGFQIRATGHNPQAAEYAGMNTSRQLILAMLISGGLAGLGGAIQTLGVKHRVYQFSGFINYGFDGLAVSLIGRNHPVGVVLAALLFGTLSYSSVTIQLMAGVPKQVIGIIQACIIFFVAADEIVKWVLKRLARKKEAAA